MRAPDSASKSVSQQALEFGAELLRATAQRHTRHAGYLVGRLWRMWRPAHLPFYVLVGVIGIAVVLLVMTAWLRLMIPMGR